MKVDSAVARNRGGFSFRLCKDFFANREQTDQQRDGTQKPAERGRNRSANIAENRNDPNCADQIAQQFSQAGKKCQFSESHGIQKESDCVHKGYKGMADALPEPEGRAVTDNRRVVKQVAKIPPAQDGEKNKAENTVQKPDHGSDGYELLKPRLVSRGIVLGTEGSDRGGEGIEGRGQGQGNAQNRDVLRRQKLV